MFVRADFFQSERIPPVVIIGSGPAGMTLGVTLAEKGISSLILEAGDRDFQNDIQDDYAGEVTGDTYFDLDATRLRQFGGSSNHWGGMCRPLDAWDFEAVADLDVPGWPIAKRDLDPYVAAADAILELSRPQDIDISEDLFEAQFVYSPPVSFADKYDAFVANSAELHVALRTAVTALTARDGTIVGVDIVDANGVPHRLRPQIVVLACGGIENSRLLLWSNSVSDQRVVANENALGRYWMEHPHVEVGTVGLKRFLQPAGPQSDGRSIVSVRPGVLQRHGALNAAARLSYSKDESRKEDVKRFLCDIDPAALDIANGLAGTEAICDPQFVQMVWEQMPDASNRIALSETLKDGFGRPTAHLKWRKTAQDYRTARIAFELVATHIVRNDVGFVRADPFLLAMENSPDTGELAGNHHMGGTRMSDTARDGVVDKNLRLHGIANGYVAGSSVFVRGGHANPTYTIVQLSLRLADHLALVLKG